MAAAAACEHHGLGTPATASAVSCKKSPCSREHGRRTRENSRRRQAALLFLSNISLDGRPVLRDPEPADPLPARIGSDTGPNGLSYGTFANLSGSVSCGSVTQRSGLLTVPPILVLPSEELLLENRRGSVPSSSNSHLLTPSPSNSSLLPSPLGPRKSSTLLSVQSCNSVSSEPRQR